MYQASAGSCWSVVIIIVVVVIIIVVVIVVVAVIIIVVGVVVVAVIFVVVIVVIATITVFLPPIPVRGLISTVPLRVVRAPHREAHLADNLEEFIRRYEITAAFRAKGPLGQKPDDIGYVVLIGLNQNRGGKRPGWKARRDRARAAIARRGGHDDHGKCNSP
jgi:hypothetical protein